MDQLTLTMEAPKGIILTVFCALTCATTVRSPKASAPSLTILDPGGVRPGSVLLWSWYMYNSKYTDTETLSSSPCGNSPDCMYQLGWAVPFIIKSIEHEEDQLAGHDIDARWELT